MGVIFSGQTVSLGAGDLHQSLKTEGNVNTGGASAFQGATNTQIHDGTFNFTGRDTINQTTNHFHATAAPDTDLVSKIRKWLAPKVDFRKIQIETLKKHTPGTGKWLLEGENFQRWLNTKGSTLWGTGIPGSGKSVVASIVTEHLEKLVNADTSGEISLACAYSRYTEPIAVEEILSGLLDQQLERSPSLASLIVPLYKHHLNGQTKPTQNELVDLLVQCSRVFKVSFYVLDGIDEAPRTVQFNLVTVLRMMKDANFFITSRPLENLESELEMAKMFRVVAHEDDIILLIGDIITRNPDLRRLLTDPALKREVTEKILEKSAGMFLHAALQLAALQECMNKAEIRLTLDALPAGLDGMYDITMARIEQQSPNRAELAKRILVFVVYAERPLEVKELQYAVAADPKTGDFDPDRIVDTLTLLSICCGLIYLEKSSPFAPQATVRLIHFTSKDALQAILAKDFPAPHAFIVSICISRLISCSFHESDIHRHSDGTLFDIFGAHPFLHYAYYCWHLHAHKCDPLSPTSQPIGRFLDLCRSFPLQTVMPLGGAYKGSSYVTTRGNGFHAASHLDLLRFMGIGSIPDPNQLTLEGGLTSLMLSLIFPLRLPKQQPPSKRAMPLLDLPGIDVNVSDTEFGHTALMLASFGDGPYHDVLDRLLQFPDISVNAADRNGMTALAHVASHGNEGAVKRLLRHPNINVDTADKWGMTPAMLATVYRHESVVRLVLEHPPPLSLTQIESPRWAELMRASKLGCPDVVAQLLGCDSSDEIPINSADEHGYTPLILASFYGHASVVHRLLQFPSIQVNLAAKNGYTALNAASERGHDMVVRYLLRIPEIDINTPKDRLTPLFSALQEGHETVAQELLQHSQINVNSRDHEGMTALIHASHGGHAVAVEMLLAHPDVDVNARATGTVWHAFTHRPRWTALTFAVQYRHLPVVQLLLQHPQVEVSDADEDGASALMWTIDSMSWHERDTATKIVHLLLQHPGIDVNATNNKGWTSLMLASAYGMMDIVELLLEVPGIRVDTVSRDNETALSIAGRSPFALSYTVQPIRDALSKHLDQSRI